MSPWNMMEHWGVTSIYLHNKASEYASILSKKQRVVDISFAGGLVREDHVFKALSLGAPFAKLICMGRSMMIPGFLGSNIEGVIKPHNRSKVNGNWDKLAPTVSEIGSHPEEIFAGYHDLQKKVGVAAMKDIPFGAIGIWTYCDKLSAGLQQLMAGARKFAMTEISRDDIMSANRETQQELGIPFMTEALDDKAKRILKGVC
jgi:glutamate synthase domain-containing protein 2